jgi:hypothetical protein
VTCRNCGQKLRGAAISRAKGKLMLPLETAVGGVGGVGWLHDSGNGGGLARPRARFGSPARDRSIQEPAGSTGCYPVTEPCARLRYPAASGIDWLLDVALEDGRLGQP